MHCILAIAYYPYQWDPGDAVRELTRQTLLIAAADRLASAAMSRRQQTGGHPAVADAGGLLRKAVEARRQSLRCLPTEPAAAQERPA